MKKFSTIFVTCALLSMICADSFGLPPLLQPIGPGYVNIDFQPVLGFEITTKCKKGEYAATYNGADITPAFIFQRMFQHTVNQSQSTDQTGWLCWHASGENGSMTEEDRIQNYNNLHNLFYCYYYENKSVCLDNAEKNITHCYKASYNTSLPDNTTNLPYNTYYTYSQNLLTQVNPFLVTCKPCPNGGTTDMESGYQAGGNSTWWWHNFNTIADCYLEEQRDETGVYEVVDDDGTAQPCYYSGE